MVELRTDGDCIGAGAIDEAIVVGGGRSIVRDGGYQRKRARRLARIGRGIGNDNSDDVWICGE